MFAGLAKNRLAEGAPLTVTLAGTAAGASTELREQTVEVPLTPVARPLIERAAVASRIARLTEWRSRLDASDAGQKTRRQAIKDDIIRLSTRYRVLSDFTALLVLETEADYERFAIDRRALADILTVGDKGVEVKRRDQPIVLLARGPGEDQGEEEDGAEPERKSAESMPEAKDELADSPDPQAPEGNVTGSTDGLVRSDDVLRVEGRVGSAEGGGGSAALSDPAPAEMVRSADPAAGNQPSLAEEPPPPARRPRSPVSRRERASSRTPPPADDRVRSDRFAGEARESPARNNRIPAYSGKLAAIMTTLAGGEVDQAILDAMAWRNEKPGDVLALIALGEALEKKGKRLLAARAYGSIIDLFPARADMRRFAGERLERLAEDGAALATDSYAKAVEQRPDHLTGHRLLGFALVRAGQHEAAFDAVAAGLEREYPGNRFAGGKRILREDLGLIAAAWRKSDPEAKATIDSRLRQAGATLASEPSLRFVLNWETDANDVDFHIYDGKRGHAFYSQRTLRSGGELYEDVTTGYGPECFTILGKPRAYPYKLQIHYYSRGPMGYGMGKLEIVEHDGEGGLLFEQRPFVIMNDNAFVDLGTVAYGGLAAARPGRAGPRRE